MQAKYKHLLDDQKRQIEVIEETIQMTKSGYAESLKELESISEEIHERRQRYKDLGDRGQGVGAEYPDTTAKVSRMSDCISWISQDPFHPVQPGG